jgi:hypothetical protein
LTKFGDGTAAGAADALVEGMLGREAYFEVHTSAFPDGEIRGLIYPVPEPATLFLMTCGLGLSRLAVRRRPRGASFR